MNLWQRRVLGVLTLGGGFLGVVTGLGVFLGEGAAPKFIGAIITLVYGFGIWCGLLMVENEPKSLSINRLYWVVQIPYFMSPLFGYFIGGGAYLYMTFKPGLSAIGWQYLLGSRFEFSLFQTGRPVVIGFNLAAFVVVVFLTREIRSRSASHAEHADRADL